MNLFSHFIVLLAVVALAACEPTNTAGEADSQTSMQGPADNQPDQSRTRPPADSNNLSGEVLETMNAAGYTYALIKTDGQQVWVAGPQTPLEVGDEVTAMETMLMGTYHSDSLDRDFDNLYFVTAIQSGSAPGEMQGIPAGRSGTKETASELQMAPMEPAEGATSIGQLFDKREALAGETVVVKGQVVKFNQAIMGRNWVHLQDGTGDADAGTHDLTVTTDDMAREGDVVTISGVVALDKDFGAGYTYDVLIEQASISPE